MSIILSFLLAQVSVVDVARSETKGYQISDGSLVFESLDFEVTIRPLAPDEFRAWLIARGVEDEFLKRPQISELMAAMAPFEVRVRNLGDQDMHFNCDRAMLWSGIRPKARLVQPTDLMSGAQPIPEPGEELLAQAVARYSIVVKPRQTERQLAVFLPEFGKRKFSRGQLEFVLDEIYYGIDAHVIRGFFTLRHGR
ncbi:MAG: hypothetical protein KDC35_04700 [Acidobacteria bacterium]|nr:hypothetical protein [Acidobacteriota bacterium]